MAARATELVAGIIDRIEERPPGPGRPPMPTIKVVETLRFFVREGVQWRELRAEAGRACGSTLRRRLDSWGAAAVLRRVHAVLIRMVRSGPEVVPWDVVVDSCSVRAKRGGELTGPNPTDRGKAGTKYHVVVSTDGIPLAAVPSAANVHDTRLFPHLLRLALAVCAAIGRLYADAGGACPPAGGAGPGGQRGQPGALPTRRHPTLHPRGGRAARVGARLGPLRGRARLRLVAGQQAAGPPAGQAGPHHPGPPDRGVHLHHREPP
jgi:transposase